MIALGLAIFYANSVMERRGFDLAHILTNNPKWLQFPIFGLFAMTCFQILALSVLTIMQGGVGRLFKLLADVARYIGLPEYRAVIHSALDTTMAELTQGDCDALAIVGHSLGSVIAIQQLLSNSECLGSVKRVLLLTMGSPIQRLFHRFFPELYPSADALAEAVLSELNAQGVEFSWNKSHVDYWNDDRVTLAVVKALQTPISVGDLIPRTDDPAPVIWPEQKCQTSFTGRTSRIWERRCHYLRALGARGRRLAKAWLWISGALVLYTLFSAHSTLRPDRVARSLWVASCTFFLLQSYESIWSNFGEPFFSAVLGILPTEHPRKTPLQSPRDLPVATDSEMFNWGRVAVFSLLSALLFVTMFVNGMYDHHTWQKTAFAQGKRLSHVAFSSDGKKVGASDGKMLYLWSLDSKGGLIQEGNPLALPSAGAVISPDLRYLAWTKGNEIDFSDLFHTTTPDRASLSSGEVEALAISSSGKYLAVLIQTISHRLRSHWLLVVDTMKKRQIQSIPVESRSTYLLTFSPDNRSLALGSFPSITQYPIENTPFAPSTSIPEYPRSIACSRDCKYIAVALSDCCYFSFINVYDVHRGKEIASMDTGGDHPVKSAAALAFSPDGETLAVVSDVATESAGLTLWKWRHHEYLGTRSRTP
jgi:hypothetical protein